MSSEEHLKETVGDAAAEAGEHMIGLMDVILLAGLLVGAFWWIRYERRKREEAAAAHRSYTLQSVPPSPTSTYNPLPVRPIKLTHFRPAVPGFFPFKYAILSLGKCFNY